MGHELKRLRRRKNTLQRMDRFSEREDHVLLIHYSCESFYDRPEGQTPRITSIAIRNFSSGQTVSFSIHKIAELGKIEFEKIENNYDKLEYEMLTEYFEFLKAHKTHDWIHWNMRDINYGFAALEHRFKVLGGEPEALDESKKFDLSRGLVALYNTGYIGHPRLEKLIRKNKITDMDFLTGKEEADAFDDKEYVKLHQSTLRKVDILANLLGRAIDGSLKTNSKWHEIYGYTPKVLIELVKDHWLISSLSIVTILAAGAEIGFDALSPFFK